MTTALYRRYRPDTFAEMIGQEHVTGPLMQALRSGRVNHAYLFSGPRGCGKTTSARILARTLNCHRNTPDSPLDTPCGECGSCVELARGGTGSLDVVEIDAASHNGVDDARDLRERATFAPARDRYKIFILDEAHMVTPQGFNALLKIVEEPPPHIKFIFATTEPDKVIGTIRSRTHHYPFRLVPPDVLSPYLEKLADAEEIQVGTGVLPLVTRAGGGSVRDSLSVMDQLIAGASGGEVGYDLAVGLLGYTHASLLDDVVDALAARDGASIFRVVDQIIATGHEPRRFVEDVLERLRDLIVIGVSGEAADAVLRDLPADQLERMRTQAGRLGVAELSRAADLVNAALTEMTGATSPRLHLELLCARLLLPGADDGAAGLAARIDRLERGGIATQTAGRPAAELAPVEPAPGGNLGGGLTGAAAARAVVDAKRGRKGGPAGGSAPSGGSGADAETAGVAGPGEAMPGPEGRASSSASTEPVAPRSQRAVEEDHRVHVPASVPPAEEPTEPAPAASSQPSAPEPESAHSPAGVGAMTTEEVRRRWPEVLETLSAARVTWSLVGQNAQVAALDGGVLKLAFRADGLARAFSNPRHTSAVEEAVYQTLGIQVKVEGIVGDGPGSADGVGPSGGAGPSGGSGPSGGPQESGGPGGGPGPGSSRVDRPGQSGGAGPQASAGAGDGGRGSQGSASGEAASSWPTQQTEAAEPAETDGWPEVPVPGARPSDGGTGAEPISSESQGGTGDANTPRGGGAGQDTAADRGAAGNRDAGSGRNMDDDASAADEAESNAGRSPADDPSANDDQDAPGHQGADNGEDPTGDRGVGDGQDAVDVWATTNIQAVPASTVGDQDASANGGTGTGAGNGSGRGGGGSSGRGGRRSSGRGGGGDEGGARGAGSTAVAVADRTAPASAPAPSSAQASISSRTPASVASTMSPDDETVPEPPPGYDDDLEPSGGRTLTPPPVPESVYASQGGPSRLTGADRAREALRRAQAARNPVAGGSPATGTASRGTPTASGADGVSYEELSADDPDLEAGGSGLVGVPLVVKVLGGTIIDEKVEQA